MTKASQARARALDILADLHRDLACAYGDEDEAHAAGDADAVALAVKRQTDIRASIRRQDEALYSARQAVARELTDGAALAAG